MSTPDEVPGVVELAGQLLDAIATTPLPSRAHDARIRLAEVIRDRRPPSDLVAGYGTGRPTGILGIAFECAEDCARCGTLHLHERPGPRPR